MLPNQSHPTHSHTQKKESFILVYGDLEVIMDDNKVQLKLGEIITVERGVNHSFSSKNGAVFEEISTQHFINDSLYTDIEIMKNYDNRKTNIILINK